MQSERILHEMLFLSILLEESIRKYKEYENKYKEASLSWTILDVRFLACLWEKTLAHKKDMMSLSPFDLITHIVSYPFCQQQLFKFFSSSLQFLHINVDEIMVFDDKISSQLWYFHNIEYSSSC